MHRSLIATAAVAAAVLSMPLSADAAKHRTHRPVKPSLKISGISVNEQNFRPGTTVTRQAPINACYGIGGPGQDPRDVQVFVFLHAVKVPKRAPITFDLTTPWDHQQLPDAETPKPTFGGSFFPNRGHAGEVFGGAPGDFYRYDDEGTGSNVFDGKYIVTATAKVNGKVLRTRGAITVAC